MRHPVAFRVDAWDVSAWARALDQMDLREEVFHLPDPDLTFDIPRAKALVVAYRLLVHSAVPTEAWWRGGRVRIDPERVAAIDFQDGRPALFVELPDGTHLLIDGNHRATAAMQADRPLRYAVLPCPLAARALDPRSPGTPAARRAFLTRGHP